MRTYNKNLIKKLAQLNILETEPIRDSSISSIYKNTDDIIIEKDTAVHKVITDNIADEDISIMIMAEQLSVLKSIKSILKFWLISGLISAGIALLTYLIILGS